MEQELSIDLNDLANMFSPEEDKSVTKETNQKEQEFEQKEKESVDLNLSDLESFFQSSEETTNKEEGKSKPKSSTGEVLKAIAKDFYQEGLLSLDKEEEVEEIVDFDSFSKALAKTISKNEFKDLTEEQKQYLKGIRAGVEPNEIASIQKNIKELEILDIAKLNGNKEWQKQLVALDLEEKGVDGDTAKTMAETLSKTNQDDFYKMSLKAKKDLETLWKGRIEEKISEKEQARAKELEIEEEKINKMKEKILKSEELIPGLKVNTETKNEIWKSIVQPTAIKGNSSPVNEVMEKYGKDENYRIALHTLHVLTKGFTDFTNIEKKFQNKVTRNIDELFKNDRFVSGGSS